MKAITIRGINSDMSVKLKQVAESEKKSVNQLVLDLLKQNIGMQKKKKYTKTHNDLDDLFGRWSDEEFDKMAKKYQVESERERKLWLKPFFWLMVFSSATPSARGSLLQMIGFFLGAALLLFPEKKMSSLTKGAVSQHLR